MSIEIHPSVQLAWAIANGEACLSGSTRIEPIHFLVAVLRIIDDGFHQEAQDMGIPRAVIKAIEELAREARRAIGIADDQITSSRRGLQRILRKGVRPNEIRMLHRSDKSREIFRRAVQRAAREPSAEISIMHLLEEILRDPPQEALRYMGKTCVGTEAGQAPASVWSSGAQWSIAGETSRIEPGPAAAPAIDEIGRDLTALARMGRLIPVIGRKAETIMLARYLQRTQKRNVILIGDAGVGKTAIVEGLAQHLSSPAAPEFLRSLRFVQINVADLISGTKYRGDMEQRVQQIVAEASRDPNLVLFFDEIHLVMKSGSGGESPLDLANILKPALASDGFRCIGATTLDEFDRYVRNDRTFMRRFQVIRVNEPSESEAIEIVRGWAQRIDQRQDVRITEEAVRSAVRLSVRYIPDRFLPDKAIDLLENAAAFTKVSSLSFNAQAPTKEAPLIGEKEVISALEEQYQILVSKEKTPNLQAVGSALEKNVVGQKAAMSELLGALARCLGASSERQSPLGVFLFCGPTGVGKTFTAEVLAAALFGPESRYLGRFNMSELKERHELARLIGAPPGFVGHEQEGSLYRFVHSCPQGMILLDEMEKAHVEVQDYFLQIFEKGEAFDSRGRSARFRNYIFVMTCNLQHKGPQGTMGFQASPGGNAAKMDWSVNLREYFRAELLGRIDAIIPFSVLNPEDFRQLLQLSVGSGQSLREGLRLEFRLSEECEEQIVKTLSSPLDGARGFLRRVKSELLVPLGDFIGQLTEGEKRVNIDWREGAVRFSVADL